MIKINQFILLATCFIILSCEKQEHISNNTIIYDIFHYSKLSENLVSNLAREIELDGLKTKDLSGLKTIDSCLFIRKSLLKIEDWNVVVIDSSLEKFNGYSKFLFEKAKSNHKLILLYSESTLSNSPVVLDLDYIRDLLRLEQAVFNDYRIFSSPLYCGWQDRVFAIPENKPFVKNEPLDVLLVSDFSTTMSRVTNIKYTVDSILLNDSKANILNNFKQIDRLAYLQIRTPKKGRYKVFGQTALHMNKDSIATKSSFYAVFDLE